ncbi:MAG: hypothetical protein Q8R88_02500 [Desulfoprunum sp.]|nr:hypothetical protein [Desulfoprunum sp.]
MRSMMMAAAKTLFLAQGVKNTSFTDIASLVHIPEQDCLCFFSSTDEILEELWSNGINSPTMVHDCATQPTSFDHKAR